MERPDIGAEHALSPQGAEFLKNTVGNNPMAFVADIFNEGFMPLMR